MDANIAKKYGTVRDGVNYSGICESNFRKIVNSEKVVRIRITKRILNK